MNTYDIKNRKLSILGILLLLCPLYMIGQVHTGIAVGYTDKHHKTVAEWNPVGIELGFINIDANIRYDFTFNVDKNNHLGGKVGINIPRLLNKKNNTIGIIPSIGYYYNFVSSDKTYLNSYNYEYSIKWTYKPKRNMLYLETIYINKTTVILLGMAAIID